MRTTECTIGLFTPDPLSTKSEPSQISCACIGIMGRTELSPDVLEPTARSILIHEQPEPWHLPFYGDATSRISRRKPPVDVCEPFGGEISLVIPRRIPADWRFQQFPSTSWSLSPCAASVWLVGPHWSEHLLTLCAWQGLPPTMLGRSESPSRYSRAARPSCIHHTRPTHCPHTRVQGSGLEFQTKGGCIAYSDHASATTADPTTLNTL